MSPNKRNKSRIKKQIVDDIIVDGTVEDIVRYYKRKSSKRKTISRGFWNILEFRSDYIYISENLGRIAVYPVNADGEIGLTGFHIEGFVAENRFCTACNHFQLYDINFDSYICPKCNSWTDGTCDDPDCEYCRRPETPLPPVFGVDDEPYQRVRGGWNRWYWIPTDSE